jgi:hypothetical protein
MLGWRTCELDLPARPTSHTACLGKTRRRRNLLIGRGGIVGLWRSEPVQTRHLDFERIVDGLWFHARDACCHRRADDPQAGGPQAGSHRALRRFRRTRHVFLGWTADCRRQALRHAGRRLVRIGVKIRIGGRRSQLVHPDRLALSSGVALLNGFALDVGAAACGGDPGSIGRGSNWFRR